MPHILRTRTTRPVARVGVLLLVGAGQVGADWQTAIAKFENLQTFKQEVADELLKMVIRSGGSGRWPAACIGGQEWQTCSRQGT